MSVLFPVGARSSLCHVLSVSYVWWVWLTQLIAPLSRVPGATDVCVRDPADRRVPELVVAELGEVGVGDLLQHVLRARALQREHGRGEEG